MDDSFGDQNGLVAADGEYNPHSGWEDLDDCKIEGSDIGVDGVSLGLGSVIVTFDEWISKDGEPGEYVGFSLSISGADSVVYTVKAGTDRYRSEDTFWLHPNGTNGPSASGISNVDFCENPPDGGGDDGTCNDPDGCDDGTGDGGDGTDGGDGGDGTCNDPDGCDDGTGDGTDGGDGTCNDPDGCDDGTGTGGDGTDGGDGTCNDPDGCTDGGGTGGDGTGGDGTCNDPDGCTDGGGTGDVCTYDSDCGPNEFCTEGLCTPYVY